MRFGGRRPPLAPNAEIIRALAGLLAETGLSEIEYAVGDHRIRVAREPAVRKASTVNGHAGAPTTAAEPSGPVETPPADKTPTGSDNPGMVSSPIVGIAYLAAQPGAAPFVRVGDAVSEGETLLIIEAMKVMNQIRASRAGRIARIFIGDAEPVEYGAPLMLIE